MKKYIKKEEKMFQKTIISKVTHPIMVFGSEIIDGIVDYSARIIKCQNLNTRVITEAVTATNELSKEEINAEDELQNFKTATRASKRKAEVSSKIMEMYFNQKVKPFRIACVLKISRYRVYREVEQDKRDLIVLKHERREREKLKQKIWVEVKTIIEKYWDERENMYFTINDIIKHLSKKVDSDEVPSRTYIEHYLKNKLGLSYKKVS